MKLLFTIGLHEKDKAILEQIQNYWGAGRIYKHGPQSIQYQAYSVKDLQIIFSHFEKFGLITQKQADYELFKQAFELIKSKKHLTMEGLTKIVAIKASLNRGLSPKLEEAFPKITPVEKPKVKNQEILDPY